MGPSYGQISESVVLSDAALAPRSVSLPRRSPSHEQLPLLASGGWISSSSSLTTLMRLCDCALTQPRSRTLRPALRPVAPRGTLRPRADVAVRIVKHCMYSLNSVQTPTWALFRLTTYFGALTLPRCIVLEYKMHWPLRFDSAAARAVVHGARVAPPDAAARPQIVYRVSFNIIRYVEYTHTRSGASRPRRRW